MSSADDDVNEPFELSLDTVQGKWLCEELGVSLKVTGQTIQYASGECYPLEVTPDGKLEVFGYRGLEKKSDASSIVWKHKETGQYLTWMYEGDNEEVEEPELDTSLIIKGSEAERTTRKRKVDYVALDKIIDNPDFSHSQLNAGSLNHLGQVPSTTRAPSEPLEADITSDFMALKNRFEKWIRTSNTDRCKEIVAKRGYLSTELSFDKNPTRIAAANRFITYLKTSGAKACIGQTGTAISIRVPDRLLSELFASLSNAAETSTSSSNSKLVDNVNEIKDRIIAYCNRKEIEPSHADDIVKYLKELEALPIDLDVLKATKIGVEINKLTKYNEEARNTLNKLKSVYLESKK